MQLSGSAGMRIGDISECSEVSADKVAGLLYICMKNEPECNKFPGLRLFEGVWVGFQNAVCEKPQVRAPMSFLVFFDLPKTGRKITQNRKRALREFVWINNKEIQPLSGKPAGACMRKRQKWTKYSVVEVCRSIF